MNCNWWFLLACKYLWKMINWLEAFPGTPWKLFFNFPAHQVILWINALSTWSLTYQTAERLSAFFFRKLRRTSELNDFSNCKHNWLVAQRRIKLARHIWTVETSIVLIFAVAWTERNNLQKIAFLASWMDASVQVYDEHYYYYKLITCKSNKMFPVSKLRERACNRIYRTNPLKQPAHAKVH